MVPNLHTRRPKCWEVASGHPRKDDPAKLRACRGECGEGYTVGRAEAHPHIFKIAPSSWTALQIDDDVGSRLGTADEKVAIGWLVERLRVVDDGA
jgi:hypothetical protein